MRSQADEPRMLNVDSVGNRSIRMFGEGMADLQHQRLLVLLIAQQDTTIAFSYAEQEGKYPRSTPGWEKYRLGPFPAIAKPKG